MYNKKNRYNILNLTQQKIQQHNKNGLNQKKNLPQTNIYIHQNVRYNKLENLRRLIRVSWT